MTETIETLDATHENRLKQGAVSGASWARPRPPRASVLQDSELLRDTLELLSDGIAIFGPDRRLIAANSKYAEMFGAVAELRRARRAVGRPAGAATASRHVRDAAARRLRVAGRARRRHGPRGPQLRGQADRRPRLQLALSPDAHRRLCHPPHRHHRAQAGRGPAARQRAAAQDRARHDPDADRHGAQGGRAHPVPLGRGVEGLRPRQALCAGAFPGPRGPRPLRARDREGGPGPRLPRRPAPRRRVLLPGDAGRTARRARGRELRRLGDQRPQRPAQQGGAAAPRGRGLPHAADHDQARVGRGPVLQPRGAGALRRRAARHRRFYVDPARRAKRYVERAQAHGLRPRLPRASPHRRRPRVLGRHLGPHHPLPRRGRQRRPRARPDRTARDRGAACRAARDDVPEREDVGPGRAARRRGARAQQPALGRRRPRADAARGRRRPRGPPPRREDQRRLRALRPDRPDLPDDGAPAAGPDRAAPRSTTSCAPRSTSPTTATPTTSASRPTSPRACRRCPPTPTRSPR